MGKIIEARCAACGLRGRASLGGNRRNFQTFLGMPVGCPACRKVTTANLHDAPPTCDGCGTAAVTRFDVALAEATPRQRLGKIWWDRCLPNGPHPCPTCGAAALRFWETIAFVD